MSRTLFGQEPRQNPINKREGEGVLNQVLYEGLTLETSALESLYGGQVTLSTLSINQTFVSTPHPGSTTVSIETNPLINSHGEALPQGQNPYLYG